VPKLARKLKTPFPIFRSIRCCVSHWELSFHERLIWEVETAVATRLLGVPGVAGDSLVDCNATLNGFFIWSLLKSRSVALSTPAPRGAQRTTRFRFCPDVRVNGGPPFMIEYGMNPWGAKSKPVTIKSPVPAFETTKVLSTKLSSHTSP